MLLDAARLGLGDDMLPCDECVDKLDKFRAWLGADAQRRSAAPLASWLVPAMPAPASLFNGSVSLQSSAGH